MVNPISPMVAGPDLWSSELFWPGATFQQCFPKRSPNCLRSQRSRYFIFIIQSTKGRIPFLKTPLYSVYSRIMPWSGFTVLGECLQGRNKWWKLGSCFPERFGRFSPRYMSRFHRNKAGVRKEFQIDSNLAEKWITCL